MKLKKVKISGYKSIKEEITLHIEDRVTILIGANDSGKSNILSALRCLNDDVAFTQAEQNWDLAEGGETFIEWTFLLSSAERSEVASGFQNQMLALNKTVKVRDLPNESAIEITERPWEKGLGEMIAAIGKDAQLESVITKKLFSGEVVMRRSVGGILEAKLVDRIAEEAVLSQIEQDLLAKRPRVELFAPVEQLTDTINLAQLGLVNEEFMQGIFRYADIWEQRRTLFTQNPATDHLLSRASTRFTDKIRKEWQQGENLSFRLSHGGQNGDHIHLYIGDPSVGGRFVRPSERSEGFSAFFKMSMRLLARTQANKASSYLFLFDEPGTALHPAGQVNLLRVFERLSDDNQIVYSTHSLFMVNHNRPQRNRVISKNEKGTKIDQKPFLKNWRAVKDSLGLILAGTFFIADRTLLVEGESDAMYVGALLGAYDRAGRADVDLNLFSVQWAGNERDFGPMARLLLEEGREVVVLVDGDAGGNKLRVHIERLNAGIDPQSALKPVYIIQIPANQSIEDILPNTDKYFEAVAQSALELVQAGLREFAPAAPKAIKEMVAALQVAKGNKTLGRHADDITATWFAEQEGISKLAIARNYITWLEATQPGDLGLVEIPGTLQSIVERLKLGSKQTDKAIVERGTA